MEPRRGTGTKGSLAAHARVRWGGEDFQEADEGKQTAARANRSDARLMPDEAGSSVRRIRRLCCARKKRVAERLDFRGRWEAE